MPKLKHSIPYTPWIEVSVAAGAEPQGLGAIVAALHYTGRDIVVLSEYEIEGPACEHLAGEPNPDDLKEFDKLVAQMRQVTYAIGVRIKVDQQAIEGLLYPD